MRKLTKAQTNILAALRYKVGNKRKRGWIPMPVLVCYDWRSVRGLISRELIVLGTRGTIGQWRLAEWHRLGGTNANP